GVGEQAGKEVAGVVAPARRGRRTRAEVERVVGERRIAARGVGEEARRLGAVPRRKRGEPRSKRLAVRRPHRLTGPRCEVCWPGEAGGEHEQRTPNAAPHAALVPRDRKSTRLNSSHVAISYAVFCLKKKKTKIEVVY